jgi:uncharacterized protein with FMN-binding domain
MRRAPIVAAGTAAGLAGVLSFHTTPPPLPLAAAPAQTTTTPKSTTPSTGTKTTAKSSTTKTVDGPVETNQYGNVQVRVSVKGGKVTDVSAVQLPQSDGRSAQISAQAAPTLRQEALTAQSAKIHGVSGATYTSTGYQASLQGALVQAGA